MKWNKIFILILLMLLPMGCKKKPKKRTAAELAMYFADLYYNQKILDAKPLYPEDMGPRLEHRAYVMVQEKEKKLYEEIGKPKIRIIQCEENNNDLTAFAEMEICNFIHINYFTDEPYVVECDTIYLEMEKDYFGWHLINLPQKYERPIKKDTLRRNVALNHVPILDVIRGDTLSYWWDMPD